MIRLGIIGCGDIANEVHGPSYMHYQNIYNDLDLVACCDLNIDRAMQFKKKFNVENAYNNIDKMLNEAKLDAIAIFVNPEYIPDIFLKISKIGLPMLLEKPPAKELNVLNRMIKHEKKYPVYHQIALNRRWMPIIQEWKEDSSDYCFNHISYDMFRVDRHEEDFSVTAIHAIDMVEYIMNSCYSHVKIEYVPIVNSKAVKIFLFGNLENGNSFQINILPVTGSVIERIMISGNGINTFIEMPIWNGVDVPGKYEIYKNGKLLKKKNGPFLSSNLRMFYTNGFYNENKYFIDSIRNNTESSIVLRNLNESVSIAEKIRNRKTVWTREDLNV